MLRNFFEISANNNLPHFPAGWGGGNGGGAVRRVGVRGGGAAVQGREEIRKFLNFYRRKNSVCVDLFQPAFYAKKPNWEDMAEFVCSVLSVGGNYAPQLIRTAVRDVHCSATSSEETFVHEVY